MTQNLATYIALPGTTAEAMEHWHEVFGGELQILRYGDMQLEGMPFTPPPNAVAWHWPLTGSLIVMLDAVTFPDASPAPEAGDAVPDPLDSALRTLTHTPAFRSAAVPDACRVIVVVSV